MKENMAETKTEECKREKCNFCNPNCEILAQQELKQNGNLEHRSVGIDTVEIINPSLCRDSWEDYSDYGGDWWGQGTYFKLYLIE